VLEAEVPPGTVALSAIGIDGPALAACAQLASRADPVAADMLAGSDAALRAIDGTAWMAVLPGQLLPEVVVGFPAGPATDAWLHGLLPEQAHAIDAAGSDVSSVQLRWSGTTWSIRRTPRAWLFATSAPALGQLGYPGLAARLAKEFAIPEQALALAVQDNAAVLHQAAGMAALASIALRVQAATGHQEAVPPPFTSQDLITAVTAISQMGAIPEVQPTVAWLAAHDQAVELTGRNLFVGAGILPTAAIYAGGMQLSDMFGAGKVLPTSSTWGTTFDVPFTLHQVQEMIQSAPIPAARAWALERLFHTAIGRDADALLPWWRAGLADARTDIRLGAIRGVRYASSLVLLQRTHVPEDLYHLAASSLQDPDAAVRAEAAEIFSHAAVMSHAQAFGLLKVPDFALESLITAFPHERSAVVMAPVITALSLFDDPRVPPLLQTALENPDATVRARALGALCQMTSSETERALVATCVSWRSDLTPIDEYPYTLGNAAHFALYAIQGPLATAAIAAELDAPEPPAAGPEPWRISGIGLRAQTIAVLVRRNYPGAVHRAVALVDACLSPKPGDAGDPNTLVLLAQCLSSVQETEAEDRLVTLVLHPDRFVAATAAQGLEQHAKAHALSPNAIRAVTQALTMSQTWGRVAARRALDVSTLSDQQRQEVARQMAQAETTFGAQAFEGYEPLTPKAPPVKPGTNDF
jgi:HEAT repeat protein